MKKRFSYCWFNEDLEVKKTKGYGDGVFSKKIIKKDSLLAIFGGRIISLNEESKLPKKYKDTGIQIYDNLVISSYDNKEPADNFNHSCDPNAGIRGQIFLVAMRDIKRGEHITFDYAMCQFYSKKYAPYYYRLKCLCGSPNCRGYITANDWKNKDLQKKYNGYFQYYLNEKIKKLP